MSAIRRSAATLSVALLSATALAASPTAYVGATLHPVAGPDIVDGTMIVDQGRIVALGGRDAVAIPAGAQVVELAGRHVWPGMIDAATDLGLVEIDAVRSTVDSHEVGDFNADLRAEVAFHPDTRRRLPGVAGGILVANVVPDGELFVGSSAAMRLDGWTWEEMTLASPIGQHLKFPEQLRPSRGFDLPSPEEFEKTRSAKMRRLDELIGVARGYDRARTAAESGQGPAIDVDPRFEAFRSVLTGRVPLFVWAEEKTQIEKALDWAKQQGFTRLVLVSGSDAALEAPRLAAEKVPVILLGVLRLPDRPSDAYDAPYSAAGRLQAAGVRLAFSDGGGSENARNLPFHAAMAVAFGLPRDAAHRALTSDAAEILGIADRVGSLAPGLEATFFVADGDPLDIRTHIERAVIRGAEVDLERDPQRQLWERYRARPAPAAPR
jgi:imidazolonepropionase-like amidohydrolase